MTLGVTLRDKLSGNQAVVTKYGQLVVAPVEYGTSSLVSLATTGVAFSLVEPLAGHGIVVTDIIASADKNVSNTTPAGIDIYTSTEIDSLTKTSALVRPQLVRADNIAMIGLNLLVPGGLFINATTTDASVLLTMIYYRIKL